MNGYSEKRMDEQCVQVAYNRELNEKATHHMLILTGKVTKTAIFVLLHLLLR